MVLLVLTLFASLSWCLPTDPLFAQQWHLPVIDAPSAWEISRGENVLVQIIDDGVQHVHPELSEQFEWKWSRNFNAGNESDPGPDVHADAHGTSCAGVATGRNNTVCGVGAAYRARLAGVRLIAGPTDDATESEGISFGMSEVDVMSCSWGPTDDGRRLEGPQRLVQKAFELAAQTGRGGRGSIWTWAAGNGGAVGDNCNYDGYANHPLTIAVGAVSDQGSRSYYSEECAAMLVAAPSNGGNKGITTCDLMGIYGYNKLPGAAGDCTDSFGGTSSAAPLVAGVVALVLGANRNLGWKDVQLILLSTASKVDPLDSDWTQNGAGRWVNHKYGFGLVNASAAVRMARSYSDYLGVKINRLYSPKKNVGEPIPQFPGPAVTSSIVFTNVSKIRCEHVQIVFTSSHPLSTELEVVLTSPSGTQSVLAELHATLVAPSVQVVTTIEGSYTLNGTTAARFGSFPETPVVGSIVHHPNLACNSDMTQSPVASNSYANKIVLVKRGNCSYVEKAVNLANLGCMAVVVYNDVLGSPNVEMSGKPHAVNVPVVMITLLDAQRILNTPGTVTLAVAVRLEKDNVEVQYDGWVFASTRLWGESLEGTWQLSVRDMYRGAQSAESQGKFVSWSLIVWNNQADNAVEEGSLVWILAIAGVIFIVAAVATLVFFKWRGLGPKLRGICSRCKLSRAAPDTMLEVTNNGLASEDDFDFNEPDTLFLSSEDDKDREEREAEVAAMNTERKAQLAVKALNGLL